MLELHSSIDEESFRDVIFLTIDKSRKSLIGIGFNLCDNRSFGIRWELYTVYIITYIIESDFTISIGF